MAGALIVLVGFLAASSTRHRPSASLGANSQPNRVAAASSAVASAELVDAPDTTGTVNLGGITAGLDHTGLSVDFSDPAGPKLVPDIAVGAEPGKAVDGLVVPVVKGLNKGSGQITTHTPNIGSIKSIEVNLGVEGGVGLTIKPTNIVSINPTFVLTRGNYFEGRVLAPPRLDVAGTYACAVSGSGLSVSVKDPFKVANSGFEIDDNIVCDGTTRTWTVTVEMGSDPLGTVTVTADLSKDYSTVADAKRDIGRSKP